MSSPFSLSKIILPLLLETVAVTPVFGMYWLIFSASEVKLVEETTASISAYSLLLAPSLNFTVPPDPSCHNSILVFAVALIPVWDKLSVINSEAYFAEDPAGIFNSFDPGSFMLQSFVGLKGRSVVPTTIWEEDPSPPIEIVWSELILFLSIDIPR